MTLKTLVHDYLVKQPLFRERKNKDRGIVNILISRHYKLGEAIRNGLLSKDFLTEAMKEYASMDRAWRQALEHDPSLRGRDYGDKEKLEQEHEIALGYVPGHDKETRELLAVVFKQPDRAFAWLKRGDTIETKKLVFLRRNAGDARGEPPKVLTEADVKKLKSL